MKATSRLHDRQVLPVLYLKSLRDIQEVRAAQVLKEFYLELRRKAVASEGGLPITTRQLESLVRLAEARARADLRQVSTLCMLSLFLLHEIHWTLGPI